MTFPNIETATSVEIYLGPKYRGNNRRENNRKENEALRLISPILRKCGVTVGSVTGEYCAENHGCDILYGQFFDGDEAAQRLADGINRLDGICAKIIDVDPKTNNKV